MSVTSDDHSWAIYGGAQFSLRSGVVCFSYKAREVDKVVVHVNSQTGEVSLPSAPCMWIPSPTSANLKVLESIDVAATRIADEHLTRSASVLADTSGSPHPNMSRSSRTGKVPFSVSLVAGSGDSSKLTAWFLARFQDGAETSYTGPIDFVRGEDWVVKEMDENDCLKQLSSQEVEILRKAIKCAVKDLKDEDSNPQKDETGTTDVECEQYPLDEE
ncbi:hypothetical protein MMC13_005740 [Lambiella insularis]|nr:hypothetical protein [Lambiella insularis]